MIRSTFFIYLVQYAKSLNLICFLPPLKRIFIALQLEYEIFQVYVHFTTQSYSIYDFHYALNFTECLLVKNLHTIPVFMLLHASSCRLCGILGGSIVVQIICLIFKMRSLIIIITIITKCVQLSMIYHGKLNGRCRSNERKPLF